MLPSRDESFQFFRPIQDDVDVLLLLSLVGSLEKVKMLSIRGHVVGRNLTAFSKVSLKENLGWPWDKIGAEFHWHGNQLFA